jgi:hypothetical protein
MCSCFALRRRLNVLAKQFAFVPTVAPDHWLALPRAATTRVRIPDHTAARRMIRARNGTPLCTQGQNLAKTLWPIASFRDGPL